MTSLMSVWLTGALLCTSYKHTLDGYVARLPAIYQVGRPEQFLSWHFPHPVMLWGSCLGEGKGLVITGDDWTEGLTTGHHNANTIDGIISPAPCLLINKESRVRLISSVPYSTAINVSLVSASVNYGHHFQLS